MTADSLSSYLPGPGQRLDAVKLITAALVSWLLHPAIWFVAGPLRWVAMIAATATQESGWNTTASGDDGESVGMLQFYRPTWEALGYPADGRTSPLWQGWACGAYVQGAIADDLRWLAIAGPFVGFPLLRVLWVSGPSAWDLGISERLDSVSLEGRAPTAWRIYRGVTLALLVALVAVIAAMRGRP